MYIAFIMHCVYVFIRAAVAECVAAADDDKRHGACGPRRIGIGQSPNESKHDVPTFVCGGRSITWHGWLLAAANIVRGPGV